MNFDPKQSDVQLIQADARHLLLPDNSVQCIVTSPPYWGLRKYAGEQELIWGGTPKIDFASLKPIPCEHDWTQRARDLHTGTNAGEKQVSNRGAFHNDAVTVDGMCARCGAWRGAFGLEPRIEMYVQHTVEILRELWRVLRPDGVLFWNIGDSYYNGDKGGYRKGRLGLRSEIQRSNMAGDIPGAPNRNPQPGLKPKDLCLIPSRVAIAAQQDGWWVRSMILWVKPNPMPESCQDRPTDAYEHILMLTKSEHYFWDADAVREPAVSGELRATFRGGGVYTNNQSFDNSRMVPCNDAGLPKPSVTERNLRNVWTFSTQPFAGAHFATFPEELPHRCILAATSAKGVCISCSAPWERVMRSKIYGNWNPGPGSNGPLKVNAQKEDRKGDAFMEDYEPPKTIGWRPTCECRGQHGKTAPCLVLDPFAGSGTTGRVALSLRRRAILADIAYGEKDEYRKLALDRISEVDVELPFL